MHGAQNHRLLNGMGIIPLIFDFVEIINFVLRNCLAVRRVIAGGVFLGKPIVKIITAKDSPMMTVKLVILISHSFGKFRRIAISRNFNLG